MIVRMRSSGSQTMGWRQIQTSFSLWWYLWNQWNHKYWVARWCHITSEPSVKILGVVIDDRLNFDGHMSLCCIERLPGSSMPLRGFPSISIFKSKTIIYNNVLWAILTTVRQPGLSVVKQTIRNLRSCKSGHWVYYIVVLFLAFMTSWRTHQVSRFWRQELKVL